MSGFVKVPGTPTELGGVWYVMPPLAIGTIEQLGDKFADLIDGEYSPERMTMIIDIVHESLTRNYADLDRAIVAKNIDLGNLQTTLKSLLAISGFTKQEGAPAGEPSATVELSGST